MPYKDKEQKKAFQAAYYLANREKMLEQSKQYYLNRDKEQSAAQHRKNHLRRTFQMTEEDYESLLNYQNGVCSICFDPPKETKLVVDHDRRCCPSTKSCGECVRGLLHKSCNAHLGWYENNQKSVELYSLMGATVSYHGEF